MAQGKKGFNGTVRIESKPKRTRQGNGQNSKASHGRKLRKGQGK